MDRPTLSPTHTRIAYLENQIITTLHKYRATIEHLEVLSEHLGSNFQIQAKYLAEPVSQCIGIEDSQPRIDTLDGEYRNATIRLRGYRSTLVALNLQLSAARLRDLTGRQGLIVDFDL